MNDMKELQRLASPGGRPQPLAFHNGRLWVGTWDTDQLYAIDPATGTVSSEFKAPGRPYGLATLGEELRVVIAIGPEEDRFLFRFHPENGFDESSKTPCPDFTGSHLASDGAKLYMTQLGKRRMIQIDDDAKIVREFPFPVRCLGIGFRPGGDFYMITADDEWENLALATADLNAPALQPKAVGNLNEEARGLAFDGSTWWTSYREASQIVSFSD